jgi:60 kDa SS-A/Ro ribonucleoprotein
MKTNTARKLDPIYTAEGARATGTDNFNQLKRLVLTCLLWEDIAYEKATDVTVQIAGLVPKLKPEQVAALACEARDRMQLRHVPLFLVRELSRIKGNGAIVADTLAHVIQRADELGEFISLYWKDKKQPLSAGVKRGLAHAFQKFDSYKLAKYNRDSSVKLRDVLFLCHAKPKDQEQADLWKRLVDGELESPDTWEVELSAGKNKKDTFERLMREDKLGGLAVLRNLRNMQRVGVDEGLIRERLLQGCKRALPFRFIAAAKYAPKLEDAIGESMLLSAAQLDKLSGRTLLVVDVSGSMRAQLSEKSEMDRLDAAAGLSILAREACESATIYATAGNDHSRTHETMEIPARRGFALSDSVKGSRQQIGEGGIFFVQCLNYIANQERREFDRVIVFTDEQDCEVRTISPTEAKRLGRFNYVVNISTEAHGISYQAGWHHIDGWSEHVLDYIKEYEELESSPVQQ